MKPRLGAALRRLRDPLVVAQALASAAGVSSYFAISTQLDGSALVQFAAINLAALIAVGGLRSGILLPSLMRLRFDKYAHVRWFVAAAWASVIVLLFGTATLLVGGTLGGTAAALVALSCAPLVQEWLKFRHMGNNSRIRVAVSEALRLLAATTLFAVPVSDGLAGQALVFATFIPSAIVLAVRVPRADRTTPVRAYRGSQIAQLGDFVASQLNSFVPMLIIGIVAGSDFFVAIRTAQTMFGPMNTVSSALNTSLVADGATSAKYADNRRLVALGRRLAWSLVALSGVLTAAVSLLVGALPAMPIEIPRTTLVSAIVLVGAQVAASSGSGVHIMVDRMLGRNREVTLARICLVSATLASYAACAPLGANAALAAGLVASTLGYPLAFWIPAELRYRRDIAPSAPKAPSNAAGS